MPRITINGEDIFYTLNSTDASDNFILIHGSGGDHSHWPEELQCFGKANVYAIDLPGHGQSGGKGRDSVEAYTKFIEAFVHELNLDQVTLFGHSLGGAIAQTAALHPRPWLSRIILVGTGARLRVDPTILSGLLTGSRTIIEELCKWSFAPDTPKSLIDPIREGFLKTSTNVTHGDYNACNKFDIMQTVSRITTPTLIISADADILTPVKYGQYLLNSIPGSKMEIIAQAGHMMALEKPAEFMQAVTGFIDE
jgi:pimeloyl-ACP methyl ester carboxylesterase